MECERGGEVREMGDKLSREDVIRMIEEGGGPEGLVLSGYDLSGVSLSNLDLHGVVFGTDWRTPHLSTACVREAVFEHCNLRGVSFIHVDLSGVSLYGSDLADARLGVVNCTETTFKRASLRGANFHGARLNNTDFSEADLRDADYHSAYIGDVKLTKAEIGERLLFEDCRKYRDFLERHEVDEETVARCLATRFLLAGDTYLALKKAFLGEAQYKEASRAYVKERQMRKRTHRPPDRARQCYPEELDGLARSGLRHRWQLVVFNVRHLCRYIADWIVELTCGYGERPLRTVWWGLATVVIFAVLYWVCGSVVSVSGAPLIWLDYLNYSLGAFSTIGFSNFATIDRLSQTLTSVEALMGIAILALLMFTLGNRISRS